MVSELAKKVHVLAFWYINVFFETMVVDFVLNELDIILTKKIIIFSLGSVGYIFKNVCFYNTYKLIFFIGSSKTSFGCIKTSTPENEKLRCCPSSPVSDLNSCQQPSGYFEKSFWCDVSTQTYENKTIDCHCKTVVRTVDCAIQVDLNEASFMELYRQMKKDKDEVSQRLENELDISVKIQRNHKHLTDKLKQEIKEKDEHIEVTYF